MLIVDKACKRAGRSPKDLKLETLLFPAPIAPAAAVAYILVSFLGCGSFLGICVFSALAGSVGPSARTYPCAPPNNTFLEAEIVGGDQFSSMMFKISTSVEYMPFEAMRAMLSIVFSTLSCTMPSPFL